MNQYVTGAMIRRLREERKLTQSGLAELLLVSDKTVSKWETGKGYPDITLVEPIARALGVSVIELLSGDDVRNTNRASNLLRPRLYVCPVCGNILTGTGEAVVSCHGIVLPPLEAEQAEGAHEMRVEVCEDEYYVTLAHPMTKEHAISFLAGVSDNSVQIVKLYPEGNAEARFKIDRTRFLYACCNRHGLYRLRV